MMDVFSINTPNRHLLIGHMVQYSHTVPDMSTDQSKKDEIKKYVGKYDGYTQAALINYMHGQDSKGQILKERSPVHSSQKTTIRHLKDLVKDGVIIELEDPNNSQIHHLHLSKEYDIINKQLEQINRLILGMGQSVHNLNKVKSLSSLYQAEYKYYFSKYVGGYSGAIRTMLYYLFQKLPSMKIKKEHSNIFYNRIIELMSSLNKQLREIESPKEDLIYIKNVFLEGKVELESSSPIQKYFNVKVMDQMIRTLENFDDQFLS